MIISDYLPKSFNMKNRKLAAGLARGQKAIAEGRTITHTKAKKRLARWLK
jgi:predicted transcriptional regulator